ncbi:MAG: hypothetical protein NTU83_07985, partial [Candidatus Hydrogenedentes bacterium]|nr:hypothetical protein [Candidatus Hydrogenedentota bacterium]
MPLLNASTVPWPDRTLYTQWHRGDTPELYRNCAAYSREYKLVDGKELYDRIADPGEASDVAAAHPDVVAKMRAGYETWFADVCGKRDFSIPSRIHLGTPHENTTLLTRQDWRCETNWSDPKSIGYWEVNVARAGRYDVACEFEPRSTSEQARFKLGNADRQMDVPAGAGTCTFKGVPIDRAEGRLEMTVTLDRKPAGVQYVTVTRM